MIRLSPKTYRWSSSKPNLQQIPNTTEEAQAVIETYRKTFPLVVTAYDEVERRVAATLFDKEPTP